MTKFYNHIVNSRKRIIVIFLILFAGCLLCKQMVAVDYDMYDYLPPESASTQALEIMNQEYSGGIPNARVMLENVSVPEVLEYKEKLHGVKSVRDVTWLDDVASVTVPLETLDQDTVETYYKDGNALLSLTIEEDQRKEAVDAIRKIIRPDNAMSGSAVTTAYATASTVEEVSKITVIAIAFVLLVLILTTTSFAEPFIVLAGLGIAIILNGGTNLIFGEISFVTNAAGSILQLAVSLDYSVFLLHRFAECRKEYSNPEEAMVQALTRSTTSILSSGLTTVIGFLALCLMRFQIGPDLGLALAKGVAISLITVFVFMPALILTTYKLIDQTQHRPFMPSFKGFGRFVSHIMMPLVIVFAILIVPGYLASNANSFYYGASHLFGTQTQVGADTAKIEDIFGKQDTYVLLIPKDSTATESELFDELHKIPQVKSILSYVDTVGTVIPEQYLDSGTLSELNSKHYTRMVMTMDAEYEGEETFSLVEKVRNTAEKYYPGQWYLAGEGVSTYDLMDTITADTVKVNLVAIGAVFLVLLITMKSLILPLILVLSIETAIWINLSIPYFADQSIFYIAYLIISSVQLGATVDYAILFTDRYKEMRQTHSKKESVIQTVSAVSISILTSGSVLTVVGFLLGIFSTHGLLSQLGYFLGKGTLCSLVIVLFVLPGLLYLFDKLIIKPKKSKEVISQ